MINGNISLNLKNSTELTHAQKFIEKVDNHLFNDFRLLKNQKLNMTPIH